MSFSISLQRVRRCSCNDKGARVREEMAYDVHISSSFYHVQLWMIVFHADNSSEKKGSPPQYH